MVPRCLSRLAVFVLVQEGLDCQSWSYIGHPCIKINSVDNIINEEWLRHFELGTVIKMNTLDSEVQLERSLFNELTLLWTLRQRYDESTNVFLFVNDDNIVVNIDQYDCLSSKCQSKFAYARASLSVATFAARARYSLRVKTLAIVGFSIIDEDARINL